MPSGAKKRKAAKKKKGLKPNTVQIHSNGDKDLKHDDDKESDSGEIVSPASQDHQNQQNQFSEGEEGNKGKHMEVSNVRSLIDQNKSNGVKHGRKEVEIVGKEDGGLVQIERVLKVEGEHVSQKITVEYVEAATESNNRGLRRSSSSSSSSSGSSEEKSDVADKNNIVAVNTPAVELVEEVDPLPNTQVTESLVGRGACNIVVGTAPASDMDKAAISEVVVHVTTCTSDADSATTCTVESVVKEKEEAKLSIVDHIPASDTIEQKIMENEKEKLGVLDDKTTVFEVLAETGLDKRDEATSAVSCEASAVSNDNAVANTSVSVRADNAEVSPACDCHHHQLPVVLPPRPVQTTSWKSCCGLFELFAGSHR